MQVIRHMGDDGTVADVQVVKPSEEPIFDSTVTRAIKAADNLEPPPTERERRVPITFSSDMFGG